MSKAVHRGQISNHDPPDAKLLDAARH